MKDHPSTAPAVSRRALLGGAACLALAGSTQGNAAPVAADRDALTLLYGMDAGLQDAALLASGDPALRNRTLRVVVAAVGDPAALPVRSLAVRFAVAGVPGGHVSFYAWNHGTGGARFTVPTVGAGGVTLVLTDIGGAESVVTLAGGSAPGVPKLRAGTYVIAARDVLPPRFLLRLLPPDEDNAPARVAVRTPDGIVLSTAAYLTLTITDAEA